MDEWINRQMGKWMYACIDPCMYGRMDTLIDWMDWVHELGGLDEWMNACMYGCMDGWIN